MICEMITNDGIIINELINPAEGSILSKLNIASVIPFNTFWKEHFTVSVLIRNSHDPELTNPEMPDSELFCMPSSRTPIQ